jgi:hypothetical protein
MKNLLLMFAIIVVFSFSVCGQKYKNVPEKVKTAFSQKFPNATNVKWGKENSKAWEAEFKMNGKAYSANYDNNANWMETEYIITTSEIPAAIKAAIDKDYAGYCIAVSELSETTSGKVYEFLLKKGIKKIEVAFYPDGNIIKKETEKEEKD